jgi:tRNA(Phe) wybutosine-synthesizing methylase Tyw3
MSHEQIYTILKAEMIDKEIVDVVLWLNSYKQISTEFSCQGGEEIETGFMTNPYVLFKCHDLNVIDLVSKQIEDYASMTVRTSNEYVPYLRFMVEFHGTEALQDFKESLSEVNG